jgi:catechol 2,3-dioxygenase-like lactoylglutathione lyase family enzyme
MRCPEIRHVAIASSQREKLGEFYKRAFGMKEVEGEGGAIYLSDGSINLALNEQYAGREASLYHFGFEDKDLDALKKEVKRPGPARKFRGGRQVNIGIKEHPGRIAGLISRARTSKDSS